METFYAVELTAGEILIIREALERSKEEPMPQWQHELIEEALHRLEDTYEKPRMTTEEAVVELEKEKEQWKGMGNETAILMVAARKQELRFWNEIEGEGI